MAFRLLTFNLHQRLRRGSWKTEATSLGQILKDQRVTVACLQELASSQSRPFLDRLEDVTGMKATFCPSVRRAGQTFGNALLTSLPQQAAQCLALPTAPWAEPRSLAHVRTRFSGQPVSIWSGHLSLTPWDQGRQARHILTQVKADSGAIRIVAGDMNTWSRRLGAAVPLDQFFGKPDHSLRTFPARFPMLALDHIRVWPKYLLKSVRVASGEQPQAESDHLPLVAEIAAPPAPASAMKTKSRILFQRQVRRAMASDEARRESAGHVN